MRHIGSSPEGPGTPGAQGRPSMFVDVRIVDDAGRALPHDGRAQGELQCRGLHVMREYFRVRASAHAIHRCHAVDSALPRAPAHFRASTVVLHLVKSHYMKQLLLLYA